MCHAEPIMGGAGEDVRPVEQVTVSTGSEQMPGYVSRPAGDAAAPAILIISDIFGASPFYQEIAGRLANEGYLALLPDLFFRLGGLEQQSMEAAMARAGRLNEQQTLGDLQAAVAYLLGRPDVQPKSPGMMGFCMGGTYAMLLAEASPDLGAACVFYGFPVNRRGGRSPIDAVERINAPLIGFWGDQDAGVGMENVQRLDQELERLNKDYRILIYPGAGHGFMARRSEADTAAAEDAWPAMLQFFDKNLRLGR
jgi:carboxymethylenebutenolidase